MSLFWTGVLSKQSAQQYTIWYVLGYQSINVFILNGSVIKIICTTIHNLVCAGFQSIQNLNEKFPYFLVYILLVEIPFIYGPICSIIWLNNSFSFLIAKRDQRRNNNLYHILFTIHCFHTIKNISDVINQIMEFRFLIYV